MMSCFPTVLHSQAVLPKIPQPISYENIRDSTPRGGATTSPSWACRPMNPRRTSISIGHKMPGAILNMKTNLSLKS